MFQDHAMLPCHFGDIPARQGKHPAGARANAAAGLPGNNRAAAQVKGPQHTALDFLLTMPCGNVTRVATEQ